MAYYPYRYAFKFCGRCGKTCIHVIYYRDTGFFEDLWYDIVGGKNGALYALQMSEIIRRDTMTSECALCARRTAGE